MLLLFTSLLRCKSCWSMLRACYVAEVVSWLASLPSLFDLFHYSSLPGKSLELRRIALVLHNRIQEGNNFGKSEQSTLGQKSSIFLKIHIFKITFLTEFIFWKSHFWQNSHSENLILHKIHIFKVSFFTKFTISNIKILGNSI